MSDIMYSELFRDEWGKLLKNCWRVVETTVVESLFL